MDHAGHQCCSAIQKESQPRTARSVRPDVQTHRHRLDRCELAVMIQLDLPAILTARTRISAGYGDFLATPRSSFLKSSFYETGGIQPELEDNES